MTGCLSVQADWPALRRRFTAQALADALRFCGWQAGDAEGIGAGSALLLRTPGGTWRLEVGPVALFWRGKALTGSPPDWPRSVSPAAARFFLTARPLGEAVPLDFDLAARRDAGSPYHLICYTEKRLRVLLSRPGQEGLCAPPPFPEEGRALALAIDRFPACVRRTAEYGDPYSVNRYALTLANAVQDFLRAGGQDRPLLSAAEVALSNTLSILGAGSK